MKKIIIAVVGVIVVVVTAILLLNMRNNGKPKEQVVEQAKQVDNIDKYGYVLFDNKSKLYHEKFKELKDVLNAKEFDDKAYAKVAAEMFAIDFYDLNTKVSNTDIGGLAFVHPDAITDFSKTATDSMYKYVETNVYGNRKQELPSVKEAKATITDHRVALEKAKDEKGYQAVVDITYEKDLGYPTKVTLSLVHVDSKLYVVEVK
jgi:uncharacterized protein YxeA